MKLKRGQVTIFIIVAIVIVAAVVAYFLVSSSLKTSKLSPTFEPIYNNFLQCIEEDTLVGIDIVGSQAGYIYLPEFEPGSAYMPFSSHLDFLGNPIPYWYYVSGNNLEEEQVPSENQIEEQLEQFLESKANTCLFDGYYSQGFEINLGEPVFDVEIEETNVKVKLDRDLLISFEEETALIKNHEISVNSKLGKLYESAKKIYDFEQEELFLEKYGIDNLRLYAPVDGVEISCSPMTWIADVVFDELQEAIETNTLALKSKGRNDDYFVVELPTDSEVRFINSRNWANAFEVTPTKENVLIAEPVGNQPGLSALGFCYVPYHFVYDVAYPVLIQVIEDEEVFQFPMAVVIQANNPRKSLDATAGIVKSPELCKYQNTFVKVSTYDTSLNPVESEISYECLSESCEIGSTEFGTLEKEFPQCANGYVVIEASGYEKTRYLYSTTEPGSVDIILDKLYNLNVELNLNNVLSNDKAIINFVGEEDFKTIVYPEQRTVELSEGQYEIHVSVYQDSSLNLEATTTEQCVEIPQTGLGGLLGLTKEKCFDVKFPAQIVSQALAGGGKTDYYVLESELKNSGTLIISAESLPTPDSLEQLQDNYLLFENKNLGISFK